MLVQRSGRPDTRRLKLLVDELLQPETAIGEAVMRAKQAERRRGLVESVAEHFPDARWQRLQEAVFGRKRTRRPLQVENHFSLQISVPDVEDLLDPRSL